MIVFLVPLSSILPLNPSTLPPTKPPRFRENLGRIIVETNRASIIRARPAASVRAFSLFLSLNVCTNVCRVRVRVSALALARTRHTEREERKGPPEGEGVRVRRIET